MANYPVAAGGTSADIPVTRNAVFSFVSDQPVIIEAKNLNTGGYVPMAQASLANDNKALIATSPTVRIRNPGVVAANVELG